MGVQRRMGVQKMINIEDKYPAALQSSWKGEPVRSTYRLLSAEY